MAFSDLQKQYDDAEPGDNKPRDTKNDFPDGEYRLKIIELKKAVSTKNGADLLFLEAEVLTPGYENHVAGNCWAVADRKGIGYTLSDIKTFIAACGLDVTLSQLDEAGYLAAFPGIVLFAKKETKGNFVNWKYWRADAEFAAAQKEHDDIDLDKDPFRETM